MSVVTLGIWDSEESYLSLESEPFKLENEAKYSSLQHGKHSTEAKQIDFQTVSTRESS